MYDYKIVEQISRKKKSMSGVLRKVMVLFAVIFVILGITISQSFMLAGFLLAALYFVFDIFSQKDYEYTLENDQLSIDVIYGKKYRKTAHVLELKELEVVAPHWHESVAKYKKNGGTEQLKKYDYTSYDDNTPYYTMIDLELEVHLYEYAYTGHFWVKDYEYLRQLEYRLAILRDKYDYLGEAYCTEEEIKLAALVEFPPLNYCCYPAVPEKYIVPRENPWIPSEKAIVYMKELAAECEDTSLLKMLEFYRKHPAKFWAKRLAVMLHQTKHSRIVDLLSERLQQATADYPRRFFGDDMERKYQQALERAKQRQRELKSQGIRADLLREEPFTIARDSLNYKLYLMIWKEQKGNRVTEIEEYICE